MKPFRNLFFLLVLVFLTTLSTAQETLPHTSFQSVKFSGGKGDDYCTIKFFELRDGNSLVYAYSQKMLDNAILYLYDSEGKLLKEDKEILKGTKEIFSGGVIELAGHVYFIKNSKIGDELVASLWDVNLLGTPQKRTEIRFTNPKTVQSPYRYLSPDGNKLLLIGPMMDKMVVLNSELEVESTHSLFKDVSSKFEERPVLDQVVIDNEGNIALSVFFKAESAAFKRPAGTWAVIGFDKKGNSQAWDVAEVFDIKTYERNVSNLSCLMNGQFAFSYRASTKLLVAIFDVSSGSIERNLSFDVSPKDDSNLYTTPELMMCASAVNQNTLALVYGESYSFGKLASSEDGGRGTVLINAKEGKVVSKHNLFPPSQIFGYYSMRELSNSNGDFSVVAGYASPVLIDLVKNNQPMPFKVYNDNMNTKKFKPYLVIHDLKNDSIEFFVGYDNPEVKPENKELYLTNRGSLVVAEFDGKNMTLHLHK